MSTKEDIQRVLNSLFVESGKRRSDLAEAIGVSRAAVSNWTNGKNSIDMDFVPGICDFFDISVDEFFGRMDARRVTVEEERLLSLYREMNEAGRAALMAAAEGLCVAYRSDSGK